YNTFSFAWGHSSYFTLHPAASPALLPYTTLFRSGQTVRRSSTGSRRPSAWAWPITSGSHHHSTRPAPGTTTTASPRCRTTCASRSEEHTSELQSRENLVCRLLLEKKNELCCSISY